MAFNFPDTGGLENGYTIKNEERGVNYTWNKERGKWVISGTALQESIEGEIESLENYLENKLEELADIKAKGVYVHRAGEEPPPPPPILIETSVWSYGVTVNPGEFYLQDSDGNGTASFSNTSKILFSEFNQDSDVITNFADQVGKSIEFVAVVRDVFAPIKFNVLSGDYDDLMNIYTYTVEFYSNDGSDQDVDPDATYSILIDDAFTPTGWEGLAWSHADGYGDVESAEFQCAGVRDGEDVADAVFESITKIKLSKAGIKTDGSTIYPSNLTELTTGRLSFNDVVTYDVIGQEDVPDGSDYVVLLVTHFRSKEGHMVFGPNNYRLRSVTIPEPPPPPDPGEWRGSSWICMDATGDAIMLPTSDGQTSGFTTNYMSVKGIWFSKRTAENLGISTEEADDMGTAGSLQIGKDAIFSITGTGMTTSDPFIAWVTFESFVPIELGGTNARSMTMGESYVITQAKTFKESNSPTAIPFEVTAGDFEGGYEGAFEMEKITEITVHDVDASDPPVTLDWSDLTKVGARFAITEYQHNIEDGVLDSGTYEVTTVEEVDDSKTKIGLNFLYGSGKLTEGETFELRTYEVLTTSEGAIMADPPVDPSVYEDGQLWFDTTNLSLNILYGGTWVPTGVSTSFGEDIKTEIDQINRDIVMIRQVNDIAMNDLANEKANKSGDVFTGQVDIKAPSSPGYALRLYANNEASHKVYVLLLYAQTNADGTTPVCFSVDGEGKTRANKLEIKRPRDDKNANSFIIKGRIKGVEGNLLKDYQRAQSSEKSDYIEYFGSASSDDSIANKRQIKAMIDDAIARPAHLRWKFDPSPSDKVSAPTVGHFHIDGNIYRFSFRTDNGINLGSPECSDKLWSGHNDDQFIMTFWVQNKEFGWEMVTSFECKTTRWGSTVGNGTPHIEFERRWSSHGSGNDFFKKHDAYYITVGGFF